MILSLFAQCTPLSDLITLCKTTLVLLWKAAGSSHLELQNSQGTVNTTYLGEPQQQALLTDYIYLASIPSFLIKKIILLEKSPQPFQNTSVSCYPNTAVELILINCSGALVAFSSSVAGAQSWQIYSQQIKDNWQSYPILHWTCQEHKGFLCSEVSPTANHSEFLEPMMSLEPVSGALTGAEGLCTGQRAVPVPATPH